MPCLRRQHQGRSLRPVKKGGELLSDASAPRIASIWRAVCQLWELPRASTWAVESSRHSSYGFYGSAHNTVAAGGKNGSYNGIGIVMVDFVLCCAVFSRVARGDVAPRDRAVSVEVNSDVSKVRAGVVSRLNPTRASSHRQPPNLLHFSGITCLIGKWINN